MNSKLLFYLFIIFSSCGLKTNPSPPPGTRLPTIESKYIYKQPLPETKKKKEKDSKQSKSDNNQ